MPGGDAQRLALEGARRQAHPVNAVPRPDRYGVENERALNDGLAGTGLHATVDGSPGQTDDGVLTWTIDLPLVSRQEAKDVAVPEVAITPGSAPLEIGYTLPSRTLTHLLTTGAVWRWPYTSARVWLLAAVVQAEQGWQVEPLIDEYFRASGLFPIRAD